MAGVDVRLRALGIELPAVPAPVGHFELGMPCRDLLFLSGQGPLLESGRLATGKVGAEVTLAQARAHAWRTGLVLLAAARQVLGSLDRIERVVKVFGMVNAVAGFRDHPTVIDGCSELLCEVFQERGRHARSAVGMGTLPGNISVEIAAVFALRSE